VRPNGDDRPHDLNRIELRICDLIADPSELLAVTAFVELRLLQLLADPGSLDPLRASRLTPAELALLADTNDRSAAQDSLDAELRHWRDGSPVIARDWIERELEGVAPLAAELGLGGVLAPLADLLSRGNAAMRWLALHRAGQPVAAILAMEARELEAREKTLEACLATDPSHALG